MKSLLFTVSKDALNILVMVYINVILQEEFVPQKQCLFAITTRIVHYCSLEVLDFMSNLA